MSLQQETESKKEREREMIEKELYRERAIVLSFSVEEHLNMTGHNYVAQCCWLQMLAAIIPHFRRGVSAPDPYNGVNAAVAEMTHTKETREKERTKRVLYSKNKLLSSTTCILNRILHLFLFQSTN